MPAQLTEQERLFGEREEEYGEFTIPNKHLFPFVRVVNSLVDEAKIRYDGSNLSVCAVDPANVAMVDVSMPVENGPDNDFVIGANVSQLSGRLQNKPRSDSNSSDIRLDVAYPNTTLQVQREYQDGVEVTFTDRFQLIDPDAIRQEPDLPDLDRDVSARVPVAPLKTFVSNAPTNEAISFEADDGTLYVGQISGEVEYEALAEVDGVAEGEGRSLYSSDYLVNILGALDKVGVGTIEMVWDDEFPITFHFSTEWGLEGEFMHAPRIRPD